ncbi:hypothetical protein B0H63DRAFT_464228 [Podospora didyma]|uniref:Uncharacterized protein n=1 Tax=Podospora didyma TaxID=330526 RepID=A0AAE0NXX6_9PEZI|nr:hypothetical protein B0H63DRAFT_464228 [Podospora didyma]
MGSFILIYFLSLLGTTVTSYLIIRRASLFPRAHLPKHPNLTVAVTLFVVAHFLAHFVQAVLKLLNSLFDHPQLVSCHQSTMPVFRVLCFSSSSYALKLNSHSDQTWS